MIIMQGYLFSSHPELSIYIEKLSYFLSFIYKTISLYVCISFKLIVETSKVKQKFAKLWARHLVIYFCVTFYWSDNTKRVAFCNIILSFYSIIVSNQGAIMWYAMQNNIQRHTKKLIAVEKIIYQFCTPCLMYFIFSNLHDLLRCEISW